MKYVSKPLQTAFQIVAAGTRVAVGASLIHLVVPAAAQAAVITVPAGGDLQAALYQAAPGDTIVLTAGARYVGQFKFPAKTGMVTLTSSGPLPDRRISPADAPLMATVASGIGAMAFDLYDAKNWTIDGVRFEANTGGYSEIIGMDRAENIVLRRLMIVVPDPQEQKRFIAGNGRNITLTQSHCSGIWRAGQDSQCFVAWDGAGPYTITDNFLEAASENVMFGGADSTSPDNVPADILIEGNLFTKRLEWKGKPRNVKNLFELKAARRVVVRNNVFERNWIDGQGGTAIVFTPRAGAAPWTAIEDVLFERNVVRDTLSHFNILGYDDNDSSGQTTRITIRQNLLLGTGGGRLATIGNEVGELVFDHNTYVNPQTGASSMITLYSEGTIALAAGGTRTPAFAVQQFTFTNNYAQANTYGLHSSIGAGTNALTGMTTGYTWTNNVLGGGYGTYPAITWTPGVADFLAQLDAEYYLLPSSVYATMGTDGADVGWNREAPAAEPEPAPPVYDPVTGPISEPVSITTATVAAGRVTVEYSAALNAIGGSGTLLWSVVSGALPDGLTLDGASGVIRGTPTAAGARTFTVRASDVADDANAATATYTIEVAAAVGVATTSLPGAVRNKAYTATLTAEHAVGSVRWNVVSGTLPAGLTLDSATGVISGRPTNNASVTFTVAASDSNTTGGKQFVMKVSNK